MDIRNTSGSKNHKSTATARASARRKRRLRNRGRLGIMMISIVVILFGVVLLIQISDSKSRLSELTVRESELIEQRDEQLAVQEELEEERVYVQTKMYVEEVAKKIGLVYPDEVIFKPED